MGAYYWLPKPEGVGLAWDIIICHDLGAWDGISHRDFWPSVLEHVASTWGKDAKVLIHRLRDQYAGFPRGRVTHPKSGYLIIHGNDAPVTDSLDRIKERFRLTDVKVTPLYDDHERVLRDDLRVVQDALGIPLSFGKTV